MTFNIQAAQLANKWKDSVVIHGEIGGTFPLNGIYLEFSAMPV
jgi:hypothetical protein